MVCCRKSLTLLFGLFMISLAVISPAEEEIEDLNDFALST